MFSAYNMVIWDGLYYDYVQIAATIYTPEEVFSLSKNMSLNKRGPGYSLAQQSHIKLDRITRYYNLL